MQVSSTVDEAVFTPDNRFIVTREFNGNIVRIWSLEGKEVTVLPFDNAVAALAVSPDSRYLLTGS